MAWTVIPLAFLLGAVIFARTGRATCDAPELPARLAGPRRMGLRHRSRAMEVTVYPTPLPPAELEGLDAAWLAVNDLAVARSTRRWAVEDYTRRLLPNDPHASVPLEAIEILWQR